MNGFFRIALARISAERTERYGESGQPCRTPCGQKKVACPAVIQNATFRFIIEGFKPSDNRGAKPKGEQPFLNKGPLQCVKGFLKINKK